MPQLESQQASNFAFGWHASLTGIRGWAILIVLAAHLGLPGSGGPVGVTIFFTLSGFLITSLLITEWDRAGAIDLRRFYLRRARRLLPALVVAVGLVFIVAAVMGQASEVAWDSMLALTYLANWARSSGDLMGIWNHTWSLSIEEQFYLLWPIGFIALLSSAGATSRRLIGVVTVLAVGSAVWRVGLEMAGASGERIYFGSDTRAEALLAGCALAAIAARRPARHVPIWVGPVALSVLLALTLAPGPSVPWPGALYSLVTVASCGLILAALRPDGGGVQLASRPMVWIGERSYSLYIWHVPVILFLAPALAGASPPIMVAVPVLVSLVLAAASYEFVERPFRRSWRPAVAPSGSIQPFSSGHLGLVVGQDETQPPPVPAQ